MKKRTESFLLAIILISGFILRFLSSAFHSYSSDELSAITRLKYDSFSDLIEQGVKIGDMHPAGVQLFMKFWSLLFGTSEVFMRLPFVLFGTFSIYLIYKIGKRYSTEVGLFSAGLWSVLLFPIIQSELARPYSPGLLFTLLSAYFILKFIFDPLNPKQKWGNALGLCLATTAAMYTHYFAFVMVGLMAATALFFIKKAVLLPYIVAGITSTFLFLPHLSITLYQTSVEGGLQWLAPPDRWWLLKFLFHGFNESWLLIICITVAIVLALLMVLKSKKITISAISLIFLIWFFGIYLTGVLLSHYLTPVLKFPVMLFSFPFLILLLARFLEPLFYYFKGIVPAILVSVALFSTTIEKRLLESVHYEVFKELSEHIRTWENQFGAEHLSIAMNISNPYYLNYYALQNGSAHQLSLDVINYGDAPILDSVLTNTNHPYFVLGYSARHTPVQFLNQSLGYFPYIVDYHQYNNSAVYLLSKKSEDERIVFDIVQSFSLSENADNWHYDQQQFDHKTGTYLADSSHSYFPQYHLPTNKQLNKNEQFISVELQADISSENEITIVAEPKNTDQTPVLDSKGNAIWMGLNVEGELLSSQKGSFKFSLPPNMPSDGYVQIYIWNRNKKAFTIQNMEVQLLHNIWNN